jgi:heme/copper-type cytochrome/quinol oxidase subunit 2
VGTYPIVCNLLCGLGHSLMRSAVHVLPPAQFQQWLNSARTSSSGSASAGAGGGAGGGGATASAASGTGTGLRAAAE